MNKKGYTLFEVMVVTGVTIIFGAAAILSLPTSLQTKTEVLDAINNLKQLISLAQQNAISQLNGAKWGVHLDATVAGNHCYQLFYGDTYATGTVVQTVCLPNGMSFISPSQGTTEDIIFEKVTGETEFGHSIVIGLDSAGGSYDETNSSNLVVAEGSGILTQTDAVPSLNFSVSANPASATVQSGGSATSAVSVAVISGIPQTVNFSATNLPANTTASFNPASCLPGCSSVLTLDTTSNTPGGSHQITLSATAGSLVRTTNFTLTVNTQTVPDAPTNLSANPGAMQISLTWQAPAFTGGSPITGYSIYRSTTSGGESAPAIGTSGVTSFTDSGLTPGVTYYYKVSAENAVGVGGMSNEAFSVPLASAPSAPQNLSAAPGGQISITWQAPASDGGSTVINYNVYRSTSSGTETFYANAGNQLSYSDSSVSVGTTYYYKVSAVNSSGESVLSNESSAAPVAVPGAPTGLSSEPADGQAILNWTAPASEGSSPVTNYKIYRGTTPGGESLINTIGNLLTYTDTGLTNGTTYYYKVSAVSAAGEGSLSSELSVALPTLWISQSTTIPWPPTCTLSNKAIHGASLVSAGGKLYLVGGIFVQYSGWSPVRCADNGILEFNSATNTWVAKAAMSAPRKNMAVSVVGDKIYAIGGILISGGTYSAANDMYDPASNTWTSKAAMPAGARQASSAAFNGKIHVVGGYTGSAYSGLNEIYDAFNNTWTTGASLSVPRLTMISSAGGRIYAAGFSTGGGAIGNHDMYDPVANTWTGKASMLTARSGFVVAGSANTVYTLGGGGPLNINESYKEDVWQSRPNLPFTIGGYGFNSGAALLNSYIYILSGTTLHHYDIGAPQNLTAVPGNGNITLNWQVPTTNNGSGVTNYKIYRGTVSGGETLLATVGNVLTYQDTGLVNGTAYYYQVSAVSGVGEGGASVEISGTPTPPWTTKAPIPVTHGSGYAVAEVNGKIYVIGGKTGGGYGCMAIGCSPPPPITYLTTNDEYDPVTNSWASRAPMSVGRQGAAAVSINGKIYVIGGYNSGGYSNAVEEYNPANNTWVSKNPMPTARMSLAANAVNGKIYATGGSSGNANEEFDPINNVWATKLNIPISMTGPASAAMNNKIYVTTGAYAVTDNYEYDPANNTWSQKASIPTWRCCAPGVSFGDNYYVLGGYGNAGFLSLNEAYNRLNDSWTVKSSMPVAMYFDSPDVAEASNGKIYVLGGGGTINLEYNPSAD